MRSFVSFYGARKPAEAAGVYFQMSEVYESQGKADELARAPARLSRPLGHDRAAWIARSRPTSGSASWRGAASCAHGAADGSCVSVERQTSSRGREV